LQVTAYIVFSSFLVAYNQEWLTFSFLYLIERYRLLSASPWPRFVN